jgi:uracil-DNA glycosylase
VEESPRNWLTKLNPLPPEERDGRASGQGAGQSRAHSPSPRSPAASRPMPEGERAKLPDSLPALLAWMADSPDTPEASWGRTRIIPSGDPQSNLMILTDMPEPGDAEAGVLMSGELGALFDRMLAAIGRARDSIWLAPLATVRPIGGRVSPEAFARLTEIARRHIALVAPTRLLIMGEAPNRALIGPEWQNVRGNFHSINLGGVEVTSVPTFHPRLLLQRPAHKAQAWKDLQLVTKGI